MPRYFYMGASGVWGTRIATASVRTGFAMTPLTRGAVQVRAGGQRRPPLRKRSRDAWGRGLCPSHGRGNRRSAAGGGCSEPVSRKCPDWRTRQWPGIGWHDGGQENPAPTERLQEVRGRNPPVTASPCQPPLGKGAYKDGGGGLPRALCALAMTGVLQ